MAFLTIFSQGVLDVVDYALVDTSRPLDGLLSEFLENRSLNGIATNSGARP